MKSFSKNYHLAGYKKILTIIFISILVFLGAFFVFKNFSNNSFSVVAKNFDSNYKKIPFDMGYVEFSFSKDLDKKTVNKNNFSINPKIDGEISLVKPNVIRYKFLDKLEIGKDISISLKNTIKTKNGKNLDKDYNYILNVVDKAKVTKITPNGKLDNLSQNIEVFFSLPMVALTNLDEKDKLPCPLNIEPKLSGKCSWLTTSVLEFIPENGFVGATKYKITVSNKEGLLYNLGEKKETEIITTPLKINTSKNFSVNSNIRLVSNFPVSLKSLKSKLSLLEYSDINDKGTKKDFNLSFFKTNDSLVVVSLKNKNFSYDKKYRLIFDKGISPKNGNLKTKTRKVIDIKSYPFLNNISFYQNVFSGSKLVDTKNFSYDIKGNSYIPSKDLFLKLSFEEDINILDKKLFSLESRDGTKKDFKIAYGKTKNGSGKIIDNKRVLNLTLNQKLENSSIYFLKINKKINFKLEKDVSYKFETSKDFEVKDIVSIDYSKTCLYVNNRIGNSFKQQIFYSEPKSKPISYRNPYNNKDNVIYDDFKKFGVESYSEFNNSKFEDEVYLKNGYCSPAKKGEYLYILNTRLNPNSIYTLKSDLKLVDVYENKLKDSINKEIKTGNIKDKDQYLYLSNNKQINMIPSNLPLVLNFQTINLDSIKVKVCELDREQYMKYMFSRNRYKKRDYKCVNTYEKNLPVKNKFWNLSNNKFDLEQDIVGGKLNSNIFLVEDDRKKISNLFIKSNVNLTLESAKNKKLLFLTDFKGNKLPELALSFYKVENLREKSNVENTSRGEKVNVKYSYKAKDGIYEIDSKSEFDFIFVDDENYSGHISVNRDMFYDYDFKYMGGVSESEKNYLYLYTERPIYKPGDKVYVKGLLRYFDFNGYKKTKVSTGTLKVLDSNNKEIFNTEVKVDKNSNFNTSFTIPKDVSLGKFSFNFVVKNNGKRDTFYKNNAHFYIEEYKKPVFKINVSSLKDNYSLGDKAKIGISPSYYFGGKLTDTKGEYSTLVQNYFFDAKDYSDYKFGEGYDYFNCLYWSYCNYDDDFKSGTGFLIGNDGNASLDYSFDSKTNSGEKIYTFNIEVEDKDTKKTVNKSVSTILHNTDAYVGINSAFWNDKKSGIKADFIVLDYNAKPLSGKKVKVELIKKEWKKVKKQGVDGVFYNDYSLEEKVEKTFNYISNSEGKIEKVIKPKNSGEYKLKVIYTGKNKKSFVSSTDLYISSDDYFFWYEPNNDTTEIIPEKTQVLVGEKALYTLKSPINKGKALFLLEKDDGILDYFVHDIKSYGDKIEIPVKESYYPNYYLRVFLIGREKDNLLPIYKRGLTSTKVSTEYKKLKIEIKKDKESYSPGNKVVLNISVKDSNNKPLANANGSVSIVDESLLALVGNPKKNPYVFFYDMKRYLGTWMASSMKNLIEKLEVKDSSNGEKGGAGEQVKGGDSKKKRGDFRDTAFWQADFETDKNGKAVIQTDKLPDNLTTWVVEVLVNTTDGNKVGVSYDTFTTSKKLLINDNLPNFFGVGDKVILSPVVFNKIGKDGEFEVSLEATNLKVNQAKKKIFLKNNSSRKVKFEVFVNNREKIENINLALSKVNFKVKSLCKDCKIKYEDEIEKNIKIQDSTVSESVSTVGSTRDNSFDQKIELGGLKEKIGQISINYGASLFNNLTSSIDYLNNFPYGCSEQRTSAIMGNFYIKMLYDSVGIDYDLKKKYLEKYDSDSKKIIKKSIDKTIKEYLVNIRKFQNIDGGFSYWYDYSSDYKRLSNFNLSIYILKSMAILNNHGYKQDEQIIQNTVNYLKNKFYKNRKEKCYDKLCKYSHTERLSVISAILTYDSNDYEAYKMYNLLNSKDIKNVSEKLEKVVVIGKLLKIESLEKQEKEKLKKESKNIVENILNEELVYTPRGAYIGKTSVYSRVKNTSLFLKAVSILGKKEIKDLDNIVDNINRWLISQKKNGSFGSTNDNISVIDAVTTYMQETGELKDINFKVSLKLNSDTIGEKIFNEKNKLELYSKSIDIKNLKNTNTFNINKSGNGKVYYDLNLKYFLPSKDVKSRDEGFSVIKEYYDFLEYKKIQDLKNAEWKKYFSGEISYKDLKYPKDVFDYLIKINNFKVGQLVLVRNKIITPDTRDKVAFEGFLPAGAQIVNPNLDTSTKKVFDIGDDIFSKKEYRLDRFFGYTNNLYPGIYNFTYLIRFTHSGEYYIKPSNIKEFYNEEVFGRTSGEKILVR